MKHLTIRTLVLLASALFLLACADKPERDRGDDVHHDHYHERPVTLPPPETISVNCPKPGTTVIVGWTKKLEKKRETRGFDLVIRGDRYGTTYRCRIIQKAGSHETE